MTVHRREFLLRTSAVLATRGSLSRPRCLARAESWSESIRPSVSVPPGTTLYDPRVKALALTAVDAARSAGARYADVRMTYTRRGWSYDQAVTLGMSVRALVDNYWGWAATPYLAEREAPRVGQSAVAVAHAHAVSRQMSPIELGTVPVVAAGTWHTPLQVDPFEVAEGQALDWVKGLDRYIKDLGRQRGDPQTTTAPGFEVAIEFQTQERVFASTEGSYLTQTVVITAPKIGFIYRGVETNLPIAAVQAGYEYVMDLPARDLIRQMMDVIDAHRLPSKPLEIGQYDVVFDATAMATVVAQTFGAAAQVDRALGYEANAGGTSYLGPDPLTQLGTHVASPLVTLTADRSTPQGIATVQWDDDGVVPEPFTLIKDGILVDYQTTREQAAWLAPWYQKQGEPVRSRGCAASVDALTLPMQHTPNLVLQPGPDAHGVEDLIAGLKHGVLVEGAFAGGLAVNMDFQQLNGLAIPGRVVEIRQGKRTAVLDGRAGFLFRSPEFWKHVTVLGGPQSVGPWCAMTSTKGEPEQHVPYSVAAVPAFIKDVAVIDITRKA